MIEKRITRSETSVYNILNNINNGQFFSVKFIKKTNGQIRKMNCRKDVKKYLKNGTLSYNPVKKGLISVWSPKDKSDTDAGYRMINIAGVLEVKTDGINYIFE